MARNDVELIRQKIRILKKTGKPKKRRAKWLPPVGLINQEREYKRDIDRYRRDLLQVTQEKLISQLPRIAAQANREVPVVNKDAYGDEIDDAINGIRFEMGKKWTKEELRQMAKRRGESVSRVNKLNQERNWKRVVGIDISAAEPWLNEYIGSFAMNNAQLITSIEDRFLAEVSTTVYQGFQSGLRWETIASQILDRYDVTDSRAELIARDQVNKLNGGLTEIRQTELGVEEYTWHTMGDEVVRESHRAHDGNTYRWDDPPSDTGHPSEEVNCRCYGEPKLDSFLE